jgi:hypothetical protein
MARGPNDETPEPRGGEAAERLRQFLDARYAPEDRPDVPVQDAGDEGATADESGDAESRRERDLSSAETQGRPSEADAGGADSPAEADAGGADSPADGAAGRASNPARRSEADRDERDTGEEK